MQYADASKIEKHISKSRLQTYASLVDGSDREALIGAYQWNKRVASALYPILQCLEISLRNAIHVAAKSYFNTSDWYDAVVKSAGDDYFRAYIKANPNKKTRFYRNGVSSGQRNNRSKWTSHHENMLVNAKEKLQKAHKKPIADAVIAELSFGFWVGLFESHYNDIQQSKRLWPQLESRVFPNLLPAERKHGKVLLKLKKIKELRNRLSHHEPIWKAHSVTDAITAVQYLNDLVDEILFLVNGISTHRNNLLYQSGKVLYFKGICSEDCLNHYIAGTPIRVLDKKRVKRYVEKAIKQPQFAPVIIKDKSKPKFIVDLWLP